MPRNIAQPTSPDITKALRYVTRRGNGSAKKLRVLMRTRFLQILGTVEGSETLCNYVHQYRSRQELTQGERSDFRESILQLLDDSQLPEDDGQEEGQEEEFGNIELAELAQQIQLFYVHTTWSSLSAENTFPEISAQYLQHFLTHYGEKSHSGDCDAEEEEFLLESSDDDNSDLEDNLGGTFLKEGDVTIISILTLILKTYIHSLEDLIEKEKDPGHVLQQEIKNGRWERIAVIVTQIKKIRIQRKIWDELDGCDFDLDLTAAITDFLLNWEILAFKRDL